MSILKTSTKNGKDVHQTILVTGCAGFIGSNLIDKLLEKGFHVIGVDNLVTGNINNLKSALDNIRFTFVELDLIEEDALSAIPTNNIETVYHLSANADIRFGALHPKKDFEQNVKVTLNVLEFCRMNDVKRIIFSSTGSIYGEPINFPTSENCSLPIQTSLYGASKMSAESFIQAYSETFNLKSIIFRFVSILGPRYSHGHVLDFYRQLKLNPTRLKVLGNGYQTKSYLHVNDCVKALVLGLDINIDKSDIFNLGTNEVCTVRESIECITKYLNVNPEIEFGVEKKGWVGDNPLIHLDVTKMNGLGWIPEFSIKESIEDTLKYFKQGTNLRRTEI
jgi:UDP-glucose 4-epimerase